MTTLTAHLIELVETLRELRLRFRQAARAEVARAVGEALREFALATICGPARYRSMAGGAYSAWNDPWRDPAEDPWHARGPCAQEVDVNDVSRHDLTMLPPALVVGMAAARWGFMRTRQLGPAILIGLLVAIGAYAGGPTVKSLLEAWSTANELLSFPRLDRRL